VGDNSDVRGKRKIKRGKMGGGVNSLRGWLEAGTRGVPGSGGDTGRREGKSGGGCSSQKPIRRKRKKIEQSNRYLGGEALKQGKKIGERRRASRSIAML